MWLQIAPPDFDVDVTLAYATADNLTGQPVYRKAECFLHRGGGEKLQAAIALARPLGLRLRIFDALRPVEAQWALWNVQSRSGIPRRPAARLAAFARRRRRPHPARRTGASSTWAPASTPSRRCRITAAPTSPVEAQRNRLLLMGLMTAAGWDFYRNEWWHYQLFDARRYPLVATPTCRGR